MQHCSEAWSVSHLPEPQDARGSVLTAAESSRNGSYSCDAGHERKPQKTLSPVKDSFIM